MLRKKFKSLEKARKFAKKTGGKVKSLGKTNMADGTKGIKVQITWPKKAKKR